MAEHAILGGLDEVDRIDHQSVGAASFGMFRQSARDPRAVTDTGEHRDTSCRSLGPDPDALAVLVELEREELADAATDDDYMGTAPAEEIDLPREPVVINAIITGERRRGEGDHPAQLRF